MIKVLVASTNPVKINATHRAFEKMFPNQKFEVKVLSAHSDVRDQPKSDEETYTGAINRANSISKLEAADYWVGIEGGVELKNNQMEAFAWVIIKSAAQKIGKGRTGT